MEESKVFYCYSYKLSKFLRLIGFKLLEECRNNEKHYWIFEKQDDLKLDKALHYWRKIRQDFNIK